MRFDTFDHEWEKVRLGLFVKEVKKYTSDFNKYPLFTFSIEDGVTPKTDRYERGFLVKKEGETFKIIEENQFLINPMNLRFGAINFSKIKRTVSVSGYYDIFEIEEKKNCYFWYGLLSNNKTIKLYNSIATGSLSEKKRVHFSQLVQLNFYVPNENERSRISILLNKISERIETQNKIIKELETLKNAILDKIINLSYSNGTKKIDKIIVEYCNKTKTNNEYPVLSSTASGIFFQSDYFKKEASSEDTTGYKCIPFGYCTYRSMSDTGKFNFNIQNITDIGIVSPAYPVFFVKEDSALFLITVLNNDKKVINDILKMKTGGTRFSLPLSKLMKLEIPWPQEDKRKIFTKIIEILSEKISIENKTLIKYKEQKDYLLQNMFI